MDALDQVQKLVTELRAIEFWDADYWRNARKDAYATVAYAARQERRTEILSQLLSLNAQTDNKEQDLWIDRHGFEFVQPLREAVVHQADDCPTCSGTGRVVQALDGEKGVAFTDGRCGECGGTGRRKHAV